MNQNSRIDVYCSSYWMEFLALHRIISTICVLVPGSLVPKLHIWSEKYGVDPRSKAGLSAHTKIIKYVNANLKVKYMYCII
jgi:hypothetical protein